MVQALKSDIQRMHENYIERLSTDRLWRARELSDLRVMHSKAETSREKVVTSRAIVVLSYAHWEGYCSSCAGTLVDFLEAKEVPYSTLPPDMLLGALAAALDSYRDTADNLVSRRKLIAIFQETLGNHIKNFDRRVILPRSNLNFERLRFIHETIGADIQPFQRYRLKIDKELVAWRHLVAHGEMFTLENYLAVAHTNLCEELMFLTKDTFETALYTH
ncbi:hypothetical protein FHS72_000775 [Loktanella ponticola]|uniref:MAE-28990/MAE-18760-like HEPN domain-containing protein n=1 Tax=Yoonia ponticola TaxID=1524255 RepID=A0A7W9BII0_9RHOB|nr:MAE_28990/MAE_18760 family HEPN-like nuclease [Yoonia ponticola]MBB5721168.1 hypothetical protein [Yoonia ponticola]